MNADYEAVIVGGGIIGATLANRLAPRTGGVLLVDDWRPNAGTPPSGGHLRPSWFGGMPKAEYEPAMGLLDEAWGLSESQFRLRPVGGHVTVYRVNTDLVMRFTSKLATRATVTGIHNLGAEPEVTLSDGRTVRTRLLVVAAGAWAAELVPGLVVKRKQGVSFRIRGAVDEPFVQPWAPYKQVVVHRQAPGELWAGDGTAVYPENWTDDRTAACAARCLGAIGNGAVKRTMVGYRPYCKVEGSEPCLLRRIGPRAWVATGAGKSGTIAAGWVAGRILNEIT